MGWTSDDRLLRLAAVCRWVCALIGLSVLVVVPTGSPTVTLSSTPAPARLSGEHCMFFTETSHYVCGEFLEFYETRGKDEIFGKPITAAFDSPDLGLYVQYFENARMEWHPHNPDPYRVQLGLLADELGYIYPPAREEQIPPVNTDFRCYFPETAHVVEYVFLDYFRDKGGLDIFGYPRSEFMYEDGGVVQYFQRARMEWYPDNPPGSQIRLTPLGEIYVERFGLPGPYDESIDGVPIDPKELNVSASVRYIITGREGGQTVYVYVTNQRGEPVPGAVVNMVVHYPSGDSLYEFEEPTDRTGFAGHYFDIQPVSAGERVVIDVAVTFGSLTGTAQTLFLPWWSEPTDGTLPAPTPTPLPTPAPTPTRLPTGVIEAE